MVAIIVPVRASSFENGMKIALVTVGFYGGLALLGWLNNYVQLEDVALKISQMGIVTPGGPTCGGGRISYADMVEVDYIPPRSVHIRHNAKDWRRKMGVRTKKLFLEHADEFVASLAATVEATTGKSLKVNVQP